MRILEIIKKLKKEKPIMKVRCISNRYFTLTKGKEYDVMGMFGEDYIIVDDFGISYVYKRKEFEEVK